MNANTVFAVVAVAAAAALGVASIYDAVTREPGDELVELEGQIRQIRTRQQTGKLTRLDLARLERLVARRDALRDALASTATTCVAA